MGPFSVDMVAGEATAWQLLQSLEEEVMSQFCPHKQLIMDQRTTLMSREFSVMH